jgi:RimJ/RimL family protein N-acetyltransferase/acyl carrier protein
MTALLRTSADGGLDLDVDTFEAFVDDLGDLLGRSFDATEPTTRLTEDLGFDSVDRLELLGLFDRAGIEVPDELVATLATLGDLHHYLATITPTRESRPEPIAATGPVSSPLESSSIILRPVTGADEPYLYRLLTTGDQLVRFRLRGMTPSPESFHQFIWERVVAQFVATTRQGRPVGLVSCFDPDFRNRYAYVAAVADPELVGTGLMAEAAMVFISYVFGEFDLRKVYAESLEPNFEQFAHGAGRFFEIEGRLRDHEYLGGRYVDALLLAAHRDRWMAAVTPAPASGDDPRNSENLWNPDAAAGN